MTSAPSQISTLNGTMPQDSTPFERRQNTLRQLHNKKVREIFADIVDPVGSYDPKKLTAANSPRRIMRDDVLIEDADSFADMWLKTELLKYMSDDDLPVILPTTDIPISVTDKPHVHLRFMEKKSTAILAKRKRTEALISFRLINKTISSVTQSDLNELKREINLAFPSTYKLKKGRFKYSYRDKQNGYELILSLLNESEARAVITKVLAIQDKTPNFELLRTSTSEKNFDAKKTITILGKTEKLPLQRPITDCYLKSAIIRFGNLKKIDLIQRAV